MNTFSKIRNSNQNEILLRRIIECISLSESMYNRAIRRYEHLDNWLTNRKIIRNFKPRIFPIGSFRLGTSIHPVQKKFRYDIDLACTLTADHSIDRFTQDELKFFIGSMLKKYLDVNYIHAEVVEKRRCWTIKYINEENFQMDILPCITAIDNPHLQFITDLDHMGECLWFEEWPTSNPVGYARWFLNRCRQQGIFSSIDENVSKLPQLTNKFVLQKIIMILKRHLEIWCNRSSEKKFASIIIATLVAQEYKGEIRICVALHNVIIRIRNRIKRDGLLSLEVVNPCDRIEIFTDRWTSHTEYEQFNDWFDDVYIDFIINFSRNQKRNRFSMLVSNLKIVRKYTRLMNEIYLRDL